MCHQGKRWCAWRIDLYSLAKARGSIKTRIVHLGGPRCWPLHQLLLTSPHLTSLHHTSYILEARLFLGIRLRHLAVAAVLSGSLFFRPRYFCNNTLNLAVGPWSRAKSENSPRKRHLLRTNSTVSLVPAIQARALSGHRLIFPWGWQWRRVTFSRHTWGHGGRPTAYAGGMWTLLPDTKGVEDLSPPVFGRLVSCALESWAISFAPLIAFLPHPAD